MMTFDMKTIGALSVLILAIASGVSSQQASQVGAQQSANVNAQLPPDDCSWPSTSEQATGAGGQAAGAGGQSAARGPSRKPLKLRTAEQGKGYLKYDRGKTITIGEWFTFTCGLDALVPKEIPVDKPIEGAETVRVTLRGYLLSARFMRGGDHDIAVELGASPEWETDHVVVEMSAGPEYCAARKALWDLVRKDGCKEDQCVLRKPVEIVVAGYVLVGNPQQGVTDYCHTATGRGMRKGDEKQGHVRGLWRLQPVLSVKKK
jgi:hypothetical protein